MPTLPISILSSYAAAAAAATPATATGMIWPCIAIGACGMSSWLYLMLTRAQQEIVGTKERRAVLERLHEARDKHLASEMEASKKAMREAKQELGAQRKKVHAAQLAMQATQKALREEVKRREAAQNERPAFAETTPRKSVEVAATPAPKAPEPPAAPAAEPAASAETLALKAQLATLTERHTNLVEALGQSKEAIKVHKLAAVRLQRRHEDLRRIDIISRSKVELLEDKLRGMGRQYYEAISELALLKGEVAPPKPKGLVQTPAQNNGENMTTEMIDPTPDSMRPTTLMAAEGEDEDEDEDHDSADAPTILDDLDAEGESDDGLPIPADFSPGEQPQA